MNQLSTAELWGDGFRERIDRRLVAAIRAAQSRHCPPQLQEALCYAVFPGGKRIRSLLCLAVAKACGGQNPKFADAVAAAVELLHCASLVHDDLACFDDAGWRRGRAALHRKFGEALAVLSGDGLVVLAFEQLAETAREYPAQLAEIVFRLARSVGSSEGMVAGQAWEFESGVDLRLYHGCKTGAIFEAATVCGALSAGAEGQQWSALGKKLGEAFQAADDVADVSANPVSLGKPTGRDSSLGRPSLVLELGLEQARPQVAHLLEDAIRAIPTCDADTRFAEWLQAAIIPLIRLRATPLSTPDACP